MQPKPAGDERAAERIDSPPGPEVSDRPERQRADTPTMVLRPRIQWRVAGPALILFAFLVLAVGRLSLIPLAFALVVLVIAFAFLPALWERIEVGPTTVRYRTWRGHRTVAFSDVDTLRLRRVPFLLLRGLRRGYKFGRYWSVPLTLRLLHEDEVLVELRCGWWNGWRELARYVVVSCPDIDLDSRTRGRLERYVGVPLPSPQE